MVPSVSPTEAIMGKAMRDAPIFGEPTRRADDSEREPSMTVA